MPELDGQLEHPVFGPIPPRTYKIPVNVPYKYAALLQIVREHPNTPAVIAVFEAGPSDVTAKRMRSNMQSIGKWLQRVYPCEVWKLSQRRIENTWSRRELWVEYIGTLPIDEADELRRQRVAMHFKGRKNSEMKIAAKTATDRLMAEAQRREQAERNHGR